jgi:hypothetical protein
MKPDPRKHLPHPNWEAAPLIADADSRTAATGMFWLLT